MFEQVLPKAAQNALAVLGKSKLLKNSYLAGGTGLALQIGHRVSIDLDFFTRQKFNARAMMRALADLPLDFQLEREDWGTILGRLGKTKFSLFSYDYPLLTNTEKFLDINIASIKDIAAMKLAAIAERGTKRDFVDLYFILAKEKILTLGEALQLYDKKFKLLRQNKTHLLKAITYFADAEGTDAPRMLKPVAWQEVKKYFEREVKHLAKQEF